MSQSRRGFLKRSSFVFAGTFTGLSFVSLPLLRAAKANESVANNGEYFVAAEYQDTKTDWFGDNRESLIIRAEDFIIGSAMGLVADEGSHKHSFAVPAAEMAKLKKGEAVTIRTGSEPGHSHLIKIDPVNFKVVGGTIIQVKVTKKS